MLGNSVLILDRSTFNSLSPLAQATAIVLERRGEVKIIDREGGRGEKLNPRRISIPMNSIGGFANEGISQSI